MKPFRKIFPLMGLLLLSLISVSLFTGCTENSRVKTFGGKATFELPAGEKLINATWKNEELWYLTRPMRPGETAETYTFQEKSSYGVIEGTYIIKEVALPAEKPYKPPVLPANTN